MATTTIEIKARRFAIPLDCPCCGATSDTEIVLPLARAARDRAAADSARTLDFPYCRHCVEHVSRWDSAGMASAGLIVIGVVAGAIVAIASNVVIGAIAIVAALAAGGGLAASRRAQARHAMRESCSTPGKAVEFLGWNGTATGLGFASIAYAARFADQNTDKLVEDPRIRKLLDSYKLARIAVPTPAAAVSVPPPLDVGEWIAKIAKTPGRVARRTMVSRALDAFRESRERDQIVRAVTAIELAALLAPLEALPTVPDKQRHLRRAIEQVRTDNIPEALQSDMLRELEDRLAALSA